MTESIARTQLNRIVYALRRNSWMLDPAWLVRDHTGVTIDRPIFLLGNQGGGLTLISRILRRNREVVSVTGNFRYWSGADELQNVMGPVLPAELTGLSHKAPPNAAFPPPRSWSYGCDAMIGAYRKTEDDFSDEVQRRLLRVLRYLVARYGSGAPVRFVDKSQVFTVRMSFLHSLLAEFDPKFVLVTRDPYVECPRAASGKAGDMARYRNLYTDQERLGLCAEHWFNSIRCVFEDEERCAIEVLRIRFEDFLTDPEHHIRRICGFTGLEFDPDMLPARHQEVPFGSHYRDRWFPLRKDINAKYLARLSEEEIALVRDRCDDVARKLGYEPPAASR